MPDYKIVYLFVQEDLYWEYRSSFHKLERELDNLPKTNWELLATNKYWDLESALYKLEDRVSLPTKVILLGLEDPKNLLSFSKFGYFVDKTITDSLEIENILEKAESNWKYGARYKGPTSNEEKGDLGSMNFF